MATIGITLEKLPDNRALVVAVEAGSLAAKVFLVGDVIVKKGRMRIEDIPWNKQQPLDWQPGRETVTVLRNGEIVRCALPKSEPAPKPDTPEPPSAELEQILDRIGNAASTAQIDEAAQQVYSSLTLTDNEKERSQKAIDRRRNVLMHAHTPRVLPPQSPRSVPGGEASGDFFRDQKRLRRQIQDDPDLSELARLLAAIIDQNLHRKRGDKYLSSWVSLETLRKAVHRRREEVTDALNELVAHGHYRFKDRGGNQSRLIIAILNETASPAPEESAMEPPINDVSQDQVTPPTTMRDQLTERQRQALVAGVAISPPKQKIEQTPEDFDFEEKWRIEKRKDEELARNWKEAGDRMMDDLVRNSAPSKSPYDGGEYDVYGWPPDPPVRR